MHVKIRMPPGFEKQNRITWEFFFVVEIFMSSIGFNKVLQSYAGADSQAQNP